MKKEGMILILSFILLICGTAFSYDIQITDNIPLSGITEMTVSPEKEIIAAVNSETKTLFLIDTNSKNIINQIFLDIRPSGVAIDPDKNQIIISSSEGKLKFIDIQSGKTLKTFSVGKTIHSIALASNPHLNKGGQAEGDVSDILYIGNSQSLMKMDLETGEIIKEIPTDDVVIGMAVNNKLGFLVVIIENGKGLSVYDSETLEFIGSSLFNAPLIKGGYRGVAVNPSTHIAVLTNSQDNSISIVSLEGDHNSPLPTGQAGSPPLILRGDAVGRGVILNGEYKGVAIDPTTNIAYIAHENGIAVIKLENPIPQITSLVPSSARSGDSGFMLSVEGSKFINNSQTQFDNKDKQTYFNTNEYLQAEIPHEALTAPGNVPVTVTNPQPGGGVSNTLTFKIYNPAPILESITPEIIPLTPDSLNSPTILGGVAEGQGGNWSLILRAYGRNFFNGSVINLNGENLKTKFISSILLEAEASNAVLNNIGEYPVVVINPAPSSFTSNAKTLKVVESGIGDQASGISDLASGIMNQASGIGSLMGRIVNTQLEPLAGVSLKIKDLKTETDDDGYFLLENIPAGKKVLLMDGSTERTKKGHYPTIPINVDIKPDTVNEMPFQVYLHKQKNYNFKNIDPAEDTILTDPEVPGFEMRIPKGVKITGWDGKANLKVSVRTVPIDRLPVKPIPKNINARTVHMFYFDKIGGGTPDAPIPVKAKNDLGLLPGEKAILWYYDESPNEGEAPNDWAIAGTGTVTPDGKFIVSDPGVGIPKFCCGAVTYAGSSTGGSSEGTGRTGPNPCH